MTDDAQYPCVRLRGPTLQTSVRLTDAERAALTAHVHKRKLTRAELIRDAMHRAGLFDPPA